MLELFTLYSRVCISNTDTHTRLIAILMYIYYALTTLYVLSFVREVTRSYWANAHHGVRIA